MITLIRLVAVTSFLSFTAAQNTVIRRCSGLPYDPSLFACCSDELINREGGEVGCCDGKVYKTADYSCILPLPGAVTSAPTESPTPAAPVVSPRVADNFRLSARPDSIYTDSTVEANPNNDFLHAAENAYVVPYHVAFSYPEDNSQSETRLVELPTTTAPPTSAPTDGMNGMNGRAGYGMPYPYSPPYPYHGYYVPGTEGMAGVNGQVNPTTTTPKPTTQASVMNGMPGYGMPYPYYPPYPYHGYYGMGMEGMAGVNGQRNPTTTTTTPKPTTQAPPAPDMPYYAYPFYPQYGYGGYYGNMGMHGMNGAEAATTPAPTTEAPKSMPLMDTPYFHGGMYGYYQELVSTSRQEQSAKVEEEKMPSKSTRENMMTDYAYPRLRLKPSTTPTPGLICEGSVVNVSAEWLTNAECCGAVPYDVRIDACEHGMVKPKPPPTAAPAPDPAIVSCTGQRYEIADPTKKDLYACCGRVLYEKTKFNCNIAAGSTAAEDLTPTTPAPTTAAPAAAAARPQYFFPPMFPRMTRGRSSMSSPQMMVMNKPAESQPMIMEKAAGDAVAEQLPKINNNLWAAQEMPQKMEIRPRTNTQEILPRINTQPWPKFQHFPQDAVLAPQQLLQTMRQPNIVQLRQPSKTEILPRINTQLWPAQTHDTQPENEAPLPRINPQGFYPARALDSTDNEEPLPRINPQGFYPARTLDSTSTAWMRRR